MEESVDQVLLHCEEGLLVRDIFSLFKLVEEQFDDSGVPHEVSTFFIPDELGIVIEHTGHLRL